MGRGIGINGETCPEAVDVILTSMRNRASSQDLFDGVSKRGPWKPNNIWQTLMCFTVNLHPAYEYWKDVSPERKFLFLREDGDYERYQPARHGRYEHGRRVV